MLRTSKCKGCGEPYLLLPHDDGYCETCMPEVVENDDDSETYQGANQQPGHPGDFED